MLKDTLVEFYSLVNEARLMVGESPARITDEVIERAFPKTVAEAQFEGCDKMLRNGVLDAVKLYIRKPPADDRQHHMNEIEPEFLPLVERLGSTSYFVPMPNGGEYMAVSDLLHNREAFDAARKYTRLKGIETIAEADKLDDLYLAVFGDE